MGCDQKPFALVPAFGTTRFHRGQDSYVETIYELPAVPNRVEQTTEILAPYLGPILHIHQGSDGYVRFGRRMDDAWENLPALSMAKLERMFPQFQQELMRDSYFGINTLWRPNDDRLTRLNACWVDIDLHRPGEIATQGQVIGKTIDMVREGSLPRPSITVYSGRGVWFLWLLVGSDGKRPKAYPEKVLAQEAINRELQRRLSGDPAACDAKRLLRVPGSTNTQAEPGCEIVRFILDLDSRGQGSQYTLEELARYLDLEADGLKRPRRELAHVGWRALWTYRFQDFKLLRDVRGGFQEGCRNHAAHIYATILQHLGFTESAIEQAVTVLAAECRPPLKDAEVRAILNQIRKTPLRKFRDEKIADYLQITPEEAKLVSRWRQPVALTEVDEMDATLSRSPRIEYRKGIIQEIVSQYGRMPSYRQLARLLQERGIAVSHVQVMKYCKTMPLPTHELPTLLLNP